MTTDQKSTSDQILVAADLAALVDLTRELAALVTGTGVGRVALSTGNVHLEVDAAAPAGAAPAQAADVVVAAAPAGQIAAGPAEPPAEHPITAPLVGVCYLAPEPGKDTFVAVGDRVEAGTQLAIVEAMKMMNPIVADRAGTVAAVHAANGEIVEFGELLFTIGSA